MNARFHWSAWSAVSTIAIVFVLSGTTAVGATLTFNATAGTTWNGTNTNWNTSGGSPTTWNSLTPDYAIISGTGTTITVGSGIVASGIDFTGNSFILDATSSGFGFGSGSNQLRLAGNNWAATINGAISSNGSMHVQAIHTGTLGFNPTPIVTFGGTSTGGWTGATTITRGVAVNLQDSNQALNSTSGITLNGGMINLTNTTANSTTNNRIKDNAAITINGGGGIRIANTAGSGLVYSEDIGDVTFNSGYSKFTFTTNQNGGSGNAQTLTLNSLTRNNYSVWSLSTSSATQIMKVNGATQTPANEIIGPWAISGNGNTDDDYATYNGTGAIVNRNATANNTETSWSTAWSANANTYTTANFTLTADRAFNTLRISAGTSTSTVGESKLATYGLLISAGISTINAGTNGFVTIPTDNGDSALYLINGNSNNPQINAPIRDNGSTKLTLVLGGGNGFPMAINGNNTYTGGTVIARSQVRNSATSGSGNLNVGHANAFGASTNYLKFDSGILNLSTFNVTVGEFSGEASSYITAGAGGTLTAGNGTSSTSSTEFKGLITAGQIVKNGGGRLTLSGINTANAATAQYTVNGGTLQFAKTDSLMQSNPANWTAAKIVVGSGGTLAFNVGGTGEFGTGNVTSLLTNLGGANGNSTAGFAGGSAIGFDTTNAAGGNFTITNVIANSTGTGGGNIGLTKLGAGTLILTNTNTYDGPTTVVGGTLLVNGDQSGATGLITVESGAALGGTGILGADLTIAAGGDLNLTGATLSSNGTSTGILNLADTATLTLGNMTFQDLTGWDWLNADVGTYKLINGNFAVDFGSTAYTSEGTAYDFGNGKKGYFASGSLLVNIVPVPEPATIVLLGVGAVFLGVRLARRRS